MGLTGRQRKKAVKGRGGGFFKVLKLSSRYSAINGYSRKAAKFAKAIDSVKLGVFVYRRENRSVPVRPDCTKKIPVKGDLDRDNLKVLKFGSASLRLAEERLNAQSCELIFSLTLSGQL
jgi:hypothetical protein